MAATSEQLKDMEGQDPATHVLGTPSLQEDSQTCIVCNKHQGVLSDSLRCVECHAFWTRLQDKPQACIVCSRHGDLCSNCLSCTDCNPFWKDGRCLRCNPFNRCYFCGDPEPDHPGRLCKNRRSAKHGPCAKCHKPFWHGRCLECNPFDKCRICGADNPDHPGRSCPNDPNL